MDTPLIITGSLALLLSPAFYIISIIRSSTRPHRLTRLAVGIATLVAFFSVWNKGGNPGALLLTAILSIQSIVIFGLSLWRGMGGGSVFDWLCFGLSIAGLVGWQLSGNPLVALWFAIFADTMAYIPALVKTWQHPHTESHTLYTLGIIGTALTMLAYPLSITSSFQAYILIMNSLMLICIYRKSIFRGLSTRSART